MDPVLIAGMVVVFVQGVKEALEKIKVVVEGKYAVILTVVACFGFTVFKTLEAALPVFSLGTLWVVFQVLIGALGGYGLVKVASWKKNGNNATPSPS